MKLPSRSEADLRKIIDAIYTLAERRWVVLAASAVAVSVSATTNEETLASVRVPASAMGRNGILRVSSLWTITNSANNKTLRHRLSTISGTAFFASVQTTQATVNACTIISNRNSEASQVSQPATLIGFDASTAAVVTGTVDTSAETTLVLTGQKASSGETITLQRYLVELYTAG